MRALPEGLAQAFTVAAGELGMCCASWLYVGEVGKEGGVDAVNALRDDLGRSFPVLDAVASRWLEGVRAPHLDVAAALEACAGAARVVVVGLEAHFLDALVQRLEGTRCALLCDAPFEVDWDRVLSNYAGRVERVSLADFQGWAGPRSVLLTWAYGVTGASTHVLPTWLRVTGEDVRTQFRSLVAWDVLGAPMYVYPRWLVEVPSHGFTHVLRA